MTLGNNRAVIVAVVGIFVLSALSGCVDYSATTERTINVELSSLALPTSEFNGTYTTEVKSDIPCDLDAGDYNDHGYWVQGQYTIIYRKTTDENVSYVQKFIKFNSPEDAEATLRAEMEKVAESVSGDVQGFDLLPLDDVGNGTSFMIKSTKMVGEYNPRRVEVRQAMFRVADVMAMIGFTGVTVPESKVFHYARGLAANIESEAVEVE